MLTIKITITALILSCLAITANADAATIQADLQNIDRDFGWYAAGAEGYGGSYGSGLAHNQTVRQVDQDINQCLRDCQATPTKSVKATECSDGVKFFKATLEPHIKGAVGAFIEEKKSTYTGAHINVDPCGDFKLFKSDMDSLLVCLGRLCPSAGRQGIKAKIDGDFNAGIKAFCS